MVENIYVAAGSMSLLGVRIPSCLYTRCLCSPLTHQITNFVGKAKRLQLLALRFVLQDMGFPSRCIALLRSSASSPFESNELAFLKASPALPSVAWQEGSTSALVSSLCFDSSFLPPEMKLVVIQALPPWGEGP